jgi:hypothetical protein
LRELKAFLKHRANFTGKIIRQGLSEHGIVKQIRSPSVKASLPLLRCRRLSFSSKTIRVRGLTACNGGDIHHHLKKFLRISHLRSASRTRTWRIDNHPPIPGTFPMSLMANATSGSEPFMSPTS